MDQQQDQNLQTQKQNLEQFESPVMGSSVGTQMAMRVALARELFRKDSKKNHENCLNISQTRNSSKDMQQL